MRFSLLASLYLCLLLYVWTHVYVHAEEQVVPDTAEVHHTLSLNFSSFTGREQKSDGALVGIPVQLRVPRVR